MLHIRYTSSYRTAYKKLSKSGRFSSERLDYIIDTLAQGRKLDAVFRDHELSGDFNGCRECHIKSDLLLVYRIENNNLVLALVNIGSHPDLFY